MHPSTAVCLLALAAATLSGCTADAPASDPGSTTVQLDGEQFEGSPEAGEPAGQGTPRAHGAFTREDGPVEVGNEPQQVPMAWARRTVTITNDFGGVAAGHVFVGTDSGDVTVLPGDADTYRVEAVLHARGLTEQDARDQLARLDVAHTDEMLPDGLHLSTRTVREPAVEPLPGFTINLGSQAWADITVYLPPGPAYELAADASSGDVAVSGLRGPQMQVDTSSGDVALAGLNAGALLASTSSGDLTLAEVKAERAELGASSGTIDGRALDVAMLVADSSSGDVRLAGVLDTLEVDTSSGDVEVDAHGSESGAYEVATSSGSATLRLLYEGGRAYQVTATTSSGSVDVDLPNSQRSDDAEGGEDPERVEAVNRDFDEARVQTVVDVSTSSGDIRVTA